MQFTHEASVTVPTLPGHAQAHWAQASTLPHLLSHLRGTAAGDADDVARFVVVLAGRHFEFAAQRTVCEPGSVCWQSLGPSFLYVLTVHAQPAGDGGTLVTVTVAYDPPGFLPDLADTLGLSKAFSRALEADLRRYAHSLSATPTLVLAD